MVLDQPQEAAVGTRSTFSAGVTELGRSYGGDLSFPVLYLRCPVELHQACVPTGCGAVEGERVGSAERERAEAGSCYGHVSISKTSRENDWGKRDYSGDFPAVEGYMCDVAFHCCIRRPVYSHTHHVPPFFVFLLF